MADRASRVGEASVAAIGELLMARLDVETSARRTLHYFSTVNVRDSYKM